MFKTVKLLSIVCAMGLLASCATQQNYRLAVNSWQSARVKQLTHVWGYPDKVQRMPNGHRLFVYIQHDRGRYPTVVNPGSTYVSTSRSGNTVVSSTPTTYSGGGRYNLKCKTWFEINSSGRIVNTSFRGNACVAGKSFVQDMSK